MRETVKDWKKEWLEKNGITNETEVLIEDSSLDSMEPYIYEGSFAKIPNKLEDKKVRECAKICNSSVPERIGAYVLVI